jgi:hypothetical protein
MHNFLRLTVVSTVLLAVFSPPLMAVHFFTDAFTGPSLDPRWTVDNSPSNIANNPASTITILNGMAVGQPCYANAYNHIETPIDANGNFVVQADVRNNYGSSWGPAVVVYWNAATYVSLKAPAGTGTYFTSIYSDGVNFTTKASSVLSPGWTMATLRIEFGSDTIKFYAMNQGDPALTYLSGLDIPRTAAFKAKSATLIVGKGYQSPDYTNPDYNNDYSSLGALDTIMIDNVLYHPLLPVPRNYFVDTFDGPDLNSRWVKDNSPINVNEPNFAGGSDIAIVNGMAQGYPTYANCYNHIETDIDASIDFAVQADIRGNYAAAWGPALEVYWDPKTFVSIKAPTNGYFCSFVGNGSTMTVLNSTKVSTGWDIATVRIEFVGGTVKFYAKASADAALTHLATLDIPRSAAFTQPYAVMVIGKGYQGFGAGYDSYMNPDYDNDYTGGRGADNDIVLIDNASYQPLGLYECGDPGTVYLQNDYNKDCQVNFKDLAIFAQEWGWCSNPQDPTCAQYWLQYAYFVDDFNNPAEPNVVNPRWKLDNSPSNPAGSGLKIANSVLQSNGCLDNLYCHIETPINAAGNFVVESSMRGNQPSSWAPSLMVYWDTTHWIRFGQFANYGLLYNDGTKSSGSEYNVPSYMSCGGWAFYTQRIEFGSDTITFYADIPGDANLYQVPGFDIPRGAWSKAAGAMLIVGKGYQGFGYNKPDFDNDYTVPGAADYLGIDYVSYQPLGTIAHCGDPGTVYFSSDLNQDCKVDMRDVATFAAQWLWCSDPANTQCDKFWKH